MEALFGVSQCSRMFLTLRATSWLKEETACADLVFSVVIWRVLNRASHGAHSRCGWLGQNGGSLILTVPMVCEGSCGGMAIVDKDVGYVDQMAKCL